MWRKKADVVVNALEEFYLKSFEGKVICTAQHIHNGNTKWFTNKRRKAHRK